MRTDKSLNQQGKKCFRVYSWVIALGLAACCGAVPRNAYANPVLAQSRSDELFENVTIAPQFSPNPLTIRGISGGSVPASGVAGRAETPTGPCVGFVQEQPDHTVELTAFFNHLSLQVESPEDTTLVITGPGGSWCNDDSQGKNPGVAGQWLAGTYQVWVGSYEKNKNHPYNIRISEVQSSSSSKLRR